MVNFDCGRPLTEAEKSGIRELGFWSARDGRGFVLEQRLLSLKHGLLTSEELFLQPLVKRAFLQEGIAGNHLQQGCILNHLSNPGHLVSVLVDDVPDAATPTQIVQILVDDPQGYSHVACIIRLLADTLENVRMGKITAAYDNKWKSYAPLRKHVMY